MSQLTSNTTAFIEAQQYSQFILDNLHDFLLPEGMWRDVSDFGSGTTLNIKTVGTVSIQDAAEDTPLNFNPIDTGTITLAITDYVGDAWKVSDDLREDGAQVDSLMSMRAMESTRALGENHESRFLSVANAAQTNANVNLVNGRPHRWVAGGASASTRVMTLSDFIAMKLAFDKANVPAAGRIAIVDPIVEATLNSISNLVNVSNNPMFEGIVTEGFAKDSCFYFANTAVETDTLANDNNSEHFDFKLDANMSGRFDSMDFGIAYYRDELKNSGINPEITIQNKY